MKVEGTGSGFTITGAMYFFFMKESYLKKLVLLSDLIARVHAACTFVDNTLLQLVQSVQHKNATIRKRDILNIFLRKQMQIPMFIFQINFIFTRYDVIFFSKTMGGRNIIYWTIFYIFQARNVTVQNFDGQ